MLKRTMFILNVLVLIAAVIALAVPTLAQDDYADENDTEIETRNKELTLQLYDETNAGNSEFFFDLLADDYFDHALGGDKETFIALYDTFSTAFPDLQFEVTHLLADGDLVAVRGIQRGTHEGNFLGMIPATGNEVEWTGIAIFRFNEEGKIAERWQNLDEMGLMTQLGVLPDMSSPGG